MTPLRSGDREAVRAPRTGTVLAFLSACAFVLLAAAACATTGGKLPERGEEASAVSPSPPAPPASDVAAPGAGDSPDATPSPSPSPFPAPSPAESPPPPSFKESWAYLMVGEESFLKPGLPVTDVGYFGAGLSSTGELTGLPDPARLKPFAGRIHLVVAETGNRALTHFVLRPGSHERKKLLNALEAEAKRYSGVQIDFEAVLPADKEHFLSFLKSLKIRIGRRTLSVAVPARTRKVAEAYDYAAIAAIADRIIIMAYDEHWSGSAPGPVASLEWCGRVAEYARSVIGPGKLVMGAPFYGRAWASVNPAKAYKNSSVDKLLKEKGITPTERREGVSYFSYEETVQVEVYFDDAASIGERLKLYAAKNVDRIAFWRLGQEDPGAWEQYRIKK